MRKFMMVFCTILTVLLLCLTQLSASASSYVLGDADGDGEVTIIDATVVQRVLAKVMDDSDGGIAVRGDVDGSGKLESIDAAYIMRYKARLSTPYAIGDVIEEPTEATTEAPTEAPTQAPTQKPTAKPDPYELPPI